VHIARAEARGHDREQQNGPLAAVAQKALEERDQKTLQMQAGKVEQMQKEIDGKQLIFHDREIDASSPPASAAAPSRQHRSTRSDETSVSAPTDRRPRPHTTATRNLAHKCLLAARDHLRADARYIEGAIGAERDRSAQMADALARCENDVAALRQWAFRLPRIVHEAVCITFSSECRSRRCCSSLCHIDREPQLPEKDTRRSQLHHRGVMENSLEIQHFEKRVTCTAFADSAIERPRPQ
jgi:hypothetical protein